MTNSITSERLRRGVARFHKGFPDEAKAYANVGRNHPDYGLSPQDHEAMKLARAQGWGAPQSYEDVRDTMQSWASLDCEFTETYANGVSVSKGGPLPDDLAESLEELRQPITEEAKRLADAGVEFVGGPVRAGQRYIVGEGGDREFFVPNDKGHSTSSNGGAA